MINQHMSQPQGQLHLCDAAVSTYTFKLLANIKAIVNRYVLNQDLHDITKHVPQSYHIKNPKHISYFTKAMTHASYCKQDNYETFEFYGDAIVKKVLSRYLYDRYPNEQNSFLTSLRSKIERSESLAEFCDMLNLTRFIRTRDTPVDISTKEDVFEAFIGVFKYVYGFNTTQALIIALVETYKNLPELIMYNDNYKEVINKYFDFMKWNKPEYETKSYRENGCTYYESSVTNWKLQSSDVDCKYISAKSKSKADSKKKCARSLLLHHNIIDQLGSITHQPFLAFDNDTTTDMSKKTIMSQNPMNKLITKPIISTIMKRYNINTPPSYDIKTFVTALTHESYVDKMGCKLPKNKSKDAPTTDLNINEKLIKANSIKLMKTSNTRLKFLGDSVISLIYAEFIFLKYITTAKDQNFLSTLRSKLVDERLLNDMANEIGIVEYMLISSNIELLHNRENIKMSAASFKAFIGAVYLEMGIIKAQQLLLAILDTHYDYDDIVDTDTNYKFNVMVLFKKHKLGRPVFFSVEESGPMHNRLFKRGLRVPGKLGNPDAVLYGEGSSKLEAEQEVSRMLIESGLLEI